MCGEPLGTGRILIETVLRSLLPTALAHGITTEAEAAAMLSVIDRDATRFPGRPLLWPLMIAAWKRKERACPGRAGAVEHRRYASGRDFAS